MLLYLCFFNFFFCSVIYGKIRNRLKGVYIKKKRLLDVYTGYLFVSRVAIFTGFILIFCCIGLHKFLFFGDLHYVCTDFSFCSTFIDYFKIFSIN